LGTIAFWQEGLVLLLQSSKSWKTVAMDLQWIRLALPELIRSQTSRGQDCERVTKAFVSVFLSQTHTFEIEDLFILSQSRPNFLLCFGLKTS
jgi:hypothetical protein